MKIAIIEDHTLIAELLARVCRQEFKFEVVLVESHGLRALPAFRLLRPDLVLLDISLPDVDGLDLAEEILRDFPKTRILALSALRDPVTLKRVSALGLHGFIDKRVQNPLLLKEAIESVSQGRGFFSPVFSQIVESLERDPKAFFRVLSPYEQNILALIGESKSDEELAKHLGIQPSTAQSRRRDIMGKLGIHTTPKLIRYAIDHGFTRDPAFSEAPKAGA